MVSNRPDDKEIHAFWLWFATIADSLGDNFDNASLLHALDAQLLGLGDITWELGPGSKTENMLAISPDGRPELLPLTKHIVSMAPDLPQWEFFPARPAKSASLEFAIIGSSGKEIDIDARPWRYVLFRFPDQTFDLVLEQNNLTKATDDDRYTAAVILLDGLLGEAVRLLRVRDVEPVFSLAFDQEPKASPISALAMHLDLLARDSHSN
jgi:hypothetical protein